MIEVFIMKKQAYLLLLDGSSASFRAARLTWDLAEKNGATVHALYVIDTPAIRRLFYCKAPGFIGSGPYLEAQEKVIGAFRAIGETLAMAYKSQSEARNLETEVVIAEGGPLETVCKYAEGRDLLIVGCEKSELDHDFGEQLLESCACPILIITPECNNLDDVYVRMDNTDTKSLDSLNDFALSIGLPEGICLTALLTSREDMHSCITSSQDKALLFWRKANEFRKLAS